MPDPQPSAFDWNRAWLDHRDRLPHVRQPNVIYFVTFRLIDSLPADRLKQLRLRRDDWLRTKPPPHSAEQEREYKQIWTTQIENWLDAGYGACVLRDPENRSFVEATLRHDDPQKYRLGDFVIMPNHVHALVQLLPGFELAKAIKAWKSISSRQIGRRLGKPGTYWMEEYFDHAARSDESLAHFARYIQANPRMLPPTDFTIGRGTLSI